MQGRARHVALAATRGRVARLAFCASLLCFSMPRPAHAAPDVAVTASTLGVRFTTSTTSGSYAHVVPSTGSNRLLIVAVGVTNTVAGAPTVSATWDPDTTSPGDEALSCPAAATIVIGTNRRIAICTRLAPSVSSGNGRVTVTLSSAETFAASAITLTGIAEVRAPTSSGPGLRFGAAPVWSTCVSGGSGYTCSLTATNTQVDDVVFDIAGQGEPTPEGTRSFTPGAGQTKYDDRATLPTDNHLRIATSLRIASGTSTSNSWLYGGGTTNNGVGHIMLPLRPAATVSAATMAPPAATYFAGVGTRVAWTTEEEVSHIGFNVWRELDGQRSRVTERLLPGSIFMTGEYPLAGRREYAVWDDRASPEARYWLEDMAAQGPVRWHGPIGLTRGNVAQGKAQRLRERVILPSHDIRSTAAVATSARAPTKVLRFRSEDSCRNPAAKGAAIKLGVSRTGWHRVEAQALFEAGLAPDIDPERLALLVNGEQVALRVVGSPTLQAIEFYGEAVDTRETDTAVYWLVHSAGKNLRIGQAAPPAGAHAAVSFTSEVTLRERALYFAPLLNGEGDNFFGAAITDRAVVQTLPLPFAQAGKPAAIEIALQGATTTPHRVQVALNGTALGTIAWNGREPIRQRFEADPSLVHGGANELTLTRAGAADSIALVDRIRGSYERGYQVTDDVLEASVPAGARFSIRGFSASDVRVIDITDRANPVELVSTVSVEGDSFAVQATTSAVPGQHVLLAFGSARVLRPAYVRANLPSTLCEEAGQELAIVAPRSFFAALAPYVAAREQQGFGVELIDIEDLYDEMTAGMHAAEAISRFVGLRRRMPAPRTRYLLLVGDASVDPRNFLGKDVQDLVPTRLIDSAAMETASDDALVDADGDGLPDLAVGRWPARSADEVQGFVARTLALQGHALFDRAALVVAGKSDGFDFTTSARDLLAVLPQASGYLDANLSTAEVAKADLAARWAQGPSFIQFLGHGSQGVWQGLLSSDEVPTLAAADYPPVVSAMTCLNGFFHDVFQDSLGERLLRAPRGAAAVWTSSTLDDSHQQRALSLAFLKHASTHALGEAIRLARHETSALSAGRTMVLLGDPTLFGTPTATPPLPPEGPPPSADGAADGSVPGTPGVDADDPALDDDGDVSKPGAAPSRAGSSASGCTVTRMAADGSSVAIPFMLALAAMGIRRRQRSRKA